MKSRKIVFLGMFLVLVVVLSIFSSSVFADSSTVTWNPNDKGPYVTLSNNNLTATPGDVRNGVRATLGKSSGKWYWEMRQDSASPIFVGIASQDTLMKSDPWQIYTQTNQRTLYAADGTKWNGSSAVAYCNGFVKSDIVGIALDMDNGTISFSVNGVDKGIAFSDLKSFSTVYAFLATGSSNGATGTANFGATPFAYQIPQGYLPYDNSNAITLPSPLNLVATAGNAIVNLSWDSVSGATSYNVKRSTTAGGPYTTIASNITTTSYADSTVTNGTTYYYVVTAVDSSNNESANSNEATATPTAPQQTGRAILTIIMTNGTEKEYDLSMPEVNAFIDWFDGRTAGTGKAYYIFNKTYNKGPYTSRKDYIAFDKISDFEVNEYPDTGN